MALFQSHSYKKTGWEILSCVYTQAFCPRNTIFFVHWKIWSIIGRYFLGLGGSSSIFVARWLLQCKCLVFKLFRSLVSEAKMNLRDKYCHRYGDSYSQSMFTGFKDEKYNKHTLKVQNSIWRERDHLTRQRRLKTQASQVH